MSPTAIANTVDCQIWFVTSRIISIHASFPLLFHLKLFEGLLQLAHVIEGKLPRFGQLRHHRLGSPTEKTQNLVKQTVAGHLTRQDRLKDVGIADFPDTT